MIFFIICFCSLFIKLVIISFVKSDFISEKAYEQWMREIPVSSGRGHIYDRNGKEIVGNKLSLTLASINYQVKHKQETAYLVSQILGCEEEKIYAHLTKNVSIEMIKPEGRKLDLKIARKIMDLNINGLYLATDSSRYYPNGDMLGQTLGFTNIDNEGLIGLEYVYDAYLKEQKGSLKIYTDAKGDLMKNMVSYYENSTPGMDVYLTIDLEVNKILDSIIKNTAKKYNPTSIIAGVTNVKTGEVLAISQYPYYNISDYQKYDQEIYNRNYLVWKSYEPGSTFKIATYSAGLEEKVFSMNEHIHCSGALNIAGANIHCWKRQGHGSQTYLEGIENSCNCAFMNIGQRLGKDTFMQYIKNFGFGQKTGIDILGEAKGILFNTKNMGPVELATSSFGQGNSATPIQLMQTMGACINGGNLMKPYILKQIVDASKSLVYDAKPQTVRRVISEKTSAQMRYALECVAALGTGRNAYVDGYRVGGKTGTAQTVDENGNYSNSNYILSFLGAAPMNDPEICVYFAMEGAKNTIQYGGVVAAPIVGEIFAQILPYLGIKKDYENQIEKEYRWYIDTPYHTVPNLINTEKSKIKQSSLYKYIFIGEGNKVIDQEPVAGERIPEGGTIILYLG